MVDEEGNVTLKLPQVNVIDAPATIPERQVLAAEQTANALTLIASFLQQGGLDRAVNTLVKGNGIAGILSGLAHHDGRNALDARMLKQNALEIVEQLELVFNKYNERLSSQAKRNPDIISAEESQGFKQEDGS